MKNEKWKPFTIPLSSLILVRYAKGCYGIMQIISSGHRFDIGEPHFNTRTEAVNRMKEIAVNYHIQVPPKR